MNEEQTKKRIAECCPEMMELSFGCEVILDLNGEKVVMLGATPDFPSGWFRTQEGIYPVGGVGGHTFKVLGHPIQLHHVLRAIGKAQDSMVLVDRNGIFYGKTLVPLNVGCAWKMECNFDNQSAETKAFIADILTRLEAQRELLK